MSAADQQQQDDGPSEGRDAETQHQTDANTDNSNNKDNKDADDKSVTARHTYIDYYKKLRKSWHDQPDVSITFEHLSHTVQLPHTRNIPNILSTAAQPFLNYGRPLYYKMTGKHNNEQHKISATKPLHVLKDCTGLLKRGELTLLLGPPGSGKSILLRALAGHLPDPQNQSGSIRYNGYSAEEALKRGWRRNKLVSYISESDSHISTLTVEETCQFAVQHGVADIDILGDKDLSELHKNKVQIVLDMLGLQGAARTYVGNALIRGISGGEKKRLTIAEMLMLNGRVLVGDDITSGLDAAVALNVMTALRDLCHETGTTIMCCLAQSTPEIFALFDRVALIRDGQIVYLGKRQEVKKYMESIGFAKPDHMDVADWLNDLLSTPEEFTSDAQSNNDANNRDDNNNNDGDERVVSETNGNAHAQDEHSPADPSRSISRNSSQDGHQAAPAKQNNANDSRTNKKQQGQTKAPLSTEEMSERWHESELYESLLNEIKDINSLSDDKKTDKLDDDTEHDSDRMKLPIIDRKHRKHNKQSGDNGNQVSEMNIKQYSDRFCYSGWHHMTLNLKRQFIITSRSRAMWLSRMFTALFVGLVLGGLFYQTPIDFAQNRVGCVLFAILAEAFNNLSELAAADEAKPVVYKHIDSSWYNSWTYTLGAAIMNAPVVIVESFIIGDAVYWLAGLDPGVDRYFFFMLMLILSSLFVAQLFRCTSYYVVNSAVAQQVDGPLVGAMVVTAGFLVSYGNFPHWLVWLYWMSPFAWVLRSVLINQFDSPQYDYLVSEMSGIPIGQPMAAAPYIRAGDQYLQASQIQIYWVWVWAGFGYIIGVNLFLFLLSDWAIANKRVTLTLGTKRPPEKMNGGNKESAGDSNKETRIAVPDKPQRQESTLEQMPFERVVLSWSHIKYTVQTESGDKALLNDISGYCEPGTLTALMGSSGAGKTTLMDVIAGRKTAGKIEGDILVNGIAKDHVSFNRITAYVEQFDLQMPWVTVRESFNFSAHLRLPESVSTEQRKAYVEEVIDILHLRDQADRLVGSLSHGEGKLTTIGVEMASNPAILFLDEPTTGLDSKAAARVIDSIRTFAAKGRTVLCTIHQPSTHLFMSFDRLLLMQTGGRTAYFGRLHKDVHTEKRDEDNDDNDVSNDNDKRDGSAIIEFFKNSGSHEFDEENDRNPANVMLEIVARTDKFHEKYEDSETSKHEKESIEKYNKHQEQDDDAKNDHTKLQRQKSDSNKEGKSGSEHNGDYIQQPRYAQTFGKQAIAVITRQYKMYWRNAPFNLTRFMAQLVLGLFYGLLFFHIAQNDTTQTDVLNTLAACYLLVGFGGIVNAASALPNVFNDRPIFYRERSSDTYIPVCYGISLFVVELLYVLAGSFIFTIPLYYLADLRGEAHLFWAALLVQYLNALCFNSLGHFLAAAAPNVLIARQVQGLAFTFSLLFGGVFFPATQMPAGYKWIFNIDPIGHAVGAIILNQYDCSNADQSTCPTIVVSGQAAGGAGQMTEQIQTFVSEGLIGIYYGTSYYWNNVGWLCLIMITLRVAAVLSTQFIAHIKR